MARLAAVTSGCPVEFELSLTNVDKSHLSSRDVAGRLQQFSDECVWLTRAATFEEKAKLFPNCTFVIGADTAIRLFEARYYEDTSSIDRVITNIRKQGCRFLVFGRTIRDQFVTSSSISIPDHMRDLFDSVSRDHFHMDVSSTVMRRISGKK